MSVITLPLQNCWFYDVESKVQHHVYSAFGKLLKVEDGNGNDVTDAPVLDPYFTYTGREYDKETGLYYYRARYYDSSTGRFISVDPNGGSTNAPRTFINKYVYAMNNPINLADPTGEFAVIGALIQGYIISEAIQGNDWAIDTLFAEAAFAAIVLSGGTAGGALGAIGSTALGSSLSAAAMSYGQTGSFTANFGKNFHTMFRISATFLTLGAIYGGVQAGTLGKPGSNEFTAGGSGLTGYAGPTTHPNPEYINAGLNLTGTGTYIAGPGLVFHESMHTLQFIGYSYLVGRAERKNQLAGSRWSFLYGGYILTNIPGAVTGAY